MNYRIKEKVHLRELCIGKGEYGIGASSVPKNDHLPTYLRITDINDNGELLTESLTSVNHYDASKYYLKENDIVFARTGASTGRAFYYEKKYGELVFAGFLIKFSLDKKKVNPKYLKYYCLSEQYKGWVKAYTGGSTRGNINANTFGDMIVEIPSRKQQDFLVKILSSLDDKIEINNKINKKLEELAQTLYKRWFVDFEFPNEYGKPYKSSGGEMVGSELGLIPKEWTVETLGKNSVSNLIKTGVSKFEGTKTYIATADVSGIDIVSFKTKITLEDKPSRANMQPVSHSLWFAKMKNSRKLIRVSSTSSYLLNRCIFSTGFAGLLVPDYPNYIWSFLISKEFDDMKNNLSNGTTMEGINNDGINRIKIIIPKKEILSKFENTINNFYEEIQFLQIQNNKLADLRDLLLPKLMSGEIEVPDME
jgi:type I restriction enzyme S subunit